MENKEKDSLLSKEEKKIEIENNNNFVERKLYSTGILPINGDFKRNIQKKIINKIYHSKKKKNN